ncbi:MAG: RecX family transcriptional regulator [Acidobacteriota bacterium]
MAKAPPDPADSDACYRTALRALSLRWHGQEELRTKLLRRRFDRSAVDEAIMRLDRERWIDDERYALSFARARLQKHFGPDRIVMELRGLRVDPAVAARAVEAAVADDPGGDHLDGLCRKKIRSLIARRGVAAVFDEKSRNKLIASLLTQGYGFGAVSLVVDARLRELQRDNEELRIHAHDQ